MMETFSILLFAAMASLPMTHRPSDFKCGLVQCGLVQHGRGHLGSQMQPRGLGMPAIFAAALAGPLGKSWYRSLMLTPEVLLKARTLGPVPFSAYSCRINLTTCQCCGVSEPMPLSRAICGAISSRHCCGSAKKPSSLTVTSVPE